MECKLEIGKPAVCINDDDQGSRRVLQKGQVYLITGMCVSDDTVFVTFQGDPFTASPCWWHERFRPVEEPKTDISIFKKMLPPSPKVTTKKKVLEDA